MAMETPAREKSTKALGLHAWFILLREKVSVDSAEGTEWRRQGQWGQRDEPR